MAMERISIEQVDEAKLRSLESAVELCGENGKVLGLFVPWRPERLPGEPDFDWAALEDEVGYAPMGLHTLEQIWKLLGAK